MEKCYEYFACDKLDCIRRKTNDMQCWEIDDASCREHCECQTLIRTELDSKLESCKLCTYYKEKNKYQQYSINTKTLARN